tara:strand:+ start:631 stop:1200 length:570 start_codon:yes stop_codon:yes gene_type:complete
MATLNEIVASETIQYFDSVAINIDATHNYYITQAPYNLTLADNNVYKAAGGLLSISDYIDNAVFSIDKLNIGIAGIVPLNEGDDSAMIKIQSLEYIDKPVIIYRSFMQNFAVAHTIILFKGFIDAVSVTYASEGDQTQVNLDISSHWTDFDRVSTRYTNSTSQQELFPNDVGFQYSVDVQKEVVWRSTV